MSLISRSTALLFPAALAVLASLAPAHAQAPRELVVARTTEIRTLDPTQTTDEVGSVTFKTVFDQLTELAPDGKVMPRLATSWTINENATVWRFKVRNGVRTHDGGTMGADDVVWTFRKIMADAAAPPRLYTAQIDRVEKEGEDEVVFHLNTPFAPFGAQVALISIVPRASFERVGAAEFALKPVGSGPYKVTQWVKDDRLVLEAVPGYWGTQPEIAKVVIRPIPTENARVNAMMTGEVDIAQQLPPTSLPQFRSNNNIKIATVPSIRIIYLGFNTSHPQLQDVKLRRAIDLAVDRNAITSRLLRGLAKPEGQIVAPVTFGYDPKIQATAYDPAAAKKLVAESSYKGERILFQYPRNRWAFASEIAQAIGGYLQAIGVNVELEGMEYTAIYGLWASKNLSAMHMFAFGPTNMDANLPLNSLVLTRAYWQDKQALALLEKQRGTADPTARLAVISDLTKLMRDAVPYSFLYNEFQAWGLKSDIEYTPRPDEAIFFHEIRWKK